MSVAFTGTQRKKLIALLEADHEDIDSMADEILKLTSELHESRALYVVVGEMAYEANGRLKGEKVVFGPYSTPGDAKLSGESLALNGIERHRWWLLPIQRGTPFAWFQARKKEREADEVAEMDQHRLAWLKDLHERDLKVAEESRERLGLKSLAEMREEYGW